jgi:hypothetical protein
LDGEGRNKGYKDKARASIEDFGVFYKTPIICQFGWGRKKQGYKGNARAGIADFLRIM